MSKTTQDQVLGHADEADGIEEYDNALPTWWLAMFFITIVWAGGYGVWYHFVGNVSQAGNYELEMAAAAEQWPAPEGGIAAIEVTPEVLAEGKEIYTTNCIGCHAADLSGGIGPDLTDAEWIHGGTLEDIGRVITDGVPEKGMLTWGPILGPDKVAKVAAYVHVQGGGQ